MPPSSHTRGVDQRRSTRSGTQFSKSRHTRLICVAAIIVTATGPASVLHAESQQAHGSISLYAYLKPYVRATPDMLDIYLAPTAEACAESSQFIDIDWNADAGSHQIQIVVLFSNSLSAMQTTNGAVLPASSIEARIGYWSWRRFPEARPHTRTAGLLLATIELGQVGRQGSKHIPIYFRVCEAGFSLASRYHGIASIRTIIR
jgi:hypothetical protein